MAGVATHAGEAPQGELMASLGLGANAPSRDLDAPPNRVTAIVAGERAVTPDAALRLSRHFGTGP